MAVKLFLAMVMVLGLSHGVSLAYGQETPRGSSLGQPVGGPKPVEALANAWDDMRASRLLGMQVINRANEALGEVREIILDSGTGRVHYAVLSFGGFLGFGDKHFIYPVSRFSPGRDPHRVVLDVERERLADTPGFGSEHWPDFNDLAYWENAQRALGERPHAPLTVRRFVRASQVLGREVEDRDGEDVGEIEDVVLNLGSGRVRYVVLDFDQPLNPRDKLMALPLRALSFPVHTDADVVLNIDPGRLDQAAAFERDAWPSMSVWQPTAAREDDGLFGPRSAQGGCWAVFFAEPEFGAPQAQLTNRSFIEEFESGPVVDPELKAVGGQAFFKEVGSVIVGPRARVIGYAEPRFRNESLSIGPGRRVTDLSRIAFHERVRSIKLQCE